MTNPATLGYVKVGFTERDPNERRKELSSATGVIHEFELYKLYQFPENTGRIAEKIAHSALKRFHASKEFFKCEPLECAKILDKAFKDVPYAQYIDSTSGKLNQGIDIEAEIKHENSVIESIAPKINIITAQIRDIETPFNEYSSRLKEENIASRLKFESKYTLMHSYEYLFVGIQHILIACFLAIMALAIWHEAPIISAAMLLPMIWIIYHTSARGKKRITARSGYIRQMNIYDEELQAKIKENQDRMNSSTAELRNELSDLTAQIIIAKQAISKLDVRNLIPHQRNTHKKRKSYWKYQKRW